jgi:hypothetical protein
MKDVARQPGESRAFFYVHNGKECVGHVIARGKTGFEAYDADDKSLGVFPSSREAAAVLVRS